MNEPNPHPSKGFSLVEVMIAVFVLSVGIIAIAGMQSTSRSSVAYSRLTVLDAVSVGRHIEQMLSLPYNHIQLADTDAGYFPQQPDHGPYPLANASSTIEWEVQDGFPSANAKRVAVTVRRPGKGGQMLKVCYNHIKVRGAVP